MGREEQVEEREVLAAIFPEEITDIDETHFRVAIALDIDSQNGGGEDSDDEGSPTIVLSVSYPATYPDVAPDLDLSYDPHGVKPAPSDLDLSADKAGLLDALLPTIEESLGMAMVFTLVTSVKEAAEQLIAERRGAAEAVLEAHRRAEEEKEDAKFHGEKVTRDSFLAWRASFLAEKEEAERKRAEEADALLLKKGGKGAGKEDKMTGRQLWEKGLAGKGWEDEEGDGSAMLPLEKATEGLKVAE